MLCLKVQHHWWTSENLKLRKIPDLVDPLAAGIWIHSILFVICELYQIEKFNIQIDSRWKQRGRGGSDGWINIWKCVDFMISWTDVQKLFQSIQILEHGCPQDRPSVTMGDYEVSPKLSATHTETDTDICWVLVFLQFGTDKQMS